YDVGFMDPSKINEDRILSDPEAVYQSIMKYMDTYHFMDTILLPFNFTFHWILVILSPDRGSVTVFDSLRKPEKEYQFLIDIFARAWDEFRTKHRGITHEKLKWNTKFPCLRQGPGNNLCGYYVCEYMHSWGCKLVTMHDVRMQTLKETVLEQPRIDAISEQLIGFILDEIVNPKGEFHYHESKDIPAGQSAAPESSRSQKS
ncbi:unnamed protein product, partial [Urochloa humidicola]